MIQPNTAFDKKRFANDVSAWRDSNNSSVRLIAAKAKVSTNIVQRVITGQIVGLIATIRICNLLGKPMQYYLTKHKPNGTKK